MTAVSELIDFKAAYRFPLQVCTCNPVWMGYRLLTDRDWQVKEEPDVKICLALLSAI
ncbi:MAG: hypothetical protein Q8941_16110 [Bacteroidota bacterium]|nr:hypothetical protein [Bacteroidota bacterium]